MAEFDEFNIIPKRFIDLEKSTLSADADPENLKFEFDDKVYFDTDSNKFPLGVVKWARKTDNIKSGGILSKRKVYGYIPVNILEHKILPEPFDASNVDENNHVVYVDALLCYVPYDKLAMKRLREITKSDQRLKDALGNFEDKLKEAGGELDERMKETLGIP
jgi:hypothetical protein